MPRGDRTGPNGMGPMTGRAAGFCAGAGAPGYANYGFGRGFGAWGRGRGAGCGFGRGGGGGRFRGWFNRIGFMGRQRAYGGVPAWGGDPAYVYYGTPAMPTREQELDSLKAQAEYLEDALESIQIQIKNLEGSTGGSI